MLDYHLKTVHLNDEEQQKLLQENEYEDSMDHSKKIIAIPAYDVTPTRIGYLSGSESITTKAYELRCDPSDSTILKNLIMHE